ncbi:hypothetical protein C7445_11223 [Alicyclobacillus sacchari]|uniref:Copper amine oxidase-like protein n=1 Tax=Alicyclobacillus sacchari TaxID=392010 RepID=A0A4R8LKI9_9BACL|nr:hypothetical protein [Alicyclobacillus sacchari]TDY43041.1 hypothetical protein C7445_11223 [Alicyclobacillus sacchari]GMA57764.1 hypothetical protein GCM10025858_22670 [Alicyclobacillus sacchari]
MKKATMIAASTVAALTLGTVTGTAFASTNTSAVIKPSPVTSNAAVDLRVSLDNLLAQHAVLAIEAMEKGYANAPDYNAVVAALDQNTQGLTQAIASVYGTSAGAEFNKMWSAHIGFFVDYVEATAKGDAALQQQALNNLEQYKTQFAHFLASANPNLSASALAEGLQEHVNELLTAFTDYVNKDYNAAAEEMVTAYNHMFMVGDALSAAIVKQFPQKFGEMATDTAAANLRVTLDQLLALHADLANLAMEEGYTGSPDFDAIANVLNQNTTDLANAIASVYGAQAGAKFNQMWSAHIGFFVDYVHAVVQGDSAAKQQALDNLAEYKTQFAQFLASANPNLDATQLADGLQAHVNELLGTFNDYVNKDYTDSESMFQESYNHMFMTGDGLAAAIVKQFPTKFESAGDTWTWSALSLEVNQMASSMPLGVWGINPSTGQSELCVPIWYVMQVLRHIGVQSHWNGHTWALTTSAKTNWNSSFAGGNVALSVNGHTVGMANDVVLTDPYSHKPTAFMTMSDVAKVLQDLGVSFQWAGSTLDIM